MKMWLKSAAAVLAVAALFALLFFSGVGFARVTHSHPEAAEEVAEMVAGWERRAQVVLAGLTPAALALWCAYRLARARSAARRARRTWYR